MKAELNIPKSKTASIYFQYLKMYYSLVVFVEIGKKIKIQNKTSLCSAEGETFLGLVEILSVSFAALNLIIFLYIRFRQNFARFEFWLSYFSNLGLSSLILYRLTRPTIANEC